MAKKKTTAKDDFKKAKTPKKKTAKKAFKKAKTKKPKEQPYTGGGNWCGTFKRNTPSWVRREQW